MRCPTMGIFDFYEYTTNFDVAIDPLWPKLHLFICLDKSNSHLMVVFVLHTRREIKHCRKDSILK